MLGRARSVLDQKITHAERVDRQQEGKKVTSLDDVEGSADKRSLSLESAPAVDQSRAKKLLAINV